MKKPGEYANSDIVYADSTTAQLASFALSGSNRMLVVYASKPFDSSVDEPTVTVGGVAMLIADSYLESGSARAYIFYLGESSLPSNGDHNIDVTYTITEDIILAAVLLTGVKDKAPEATLLTGSGTGGTSFDLDLATVSDRAVAAAFSSKRFSEDQAFTGDFTERAQVLNTASGWAHSFTTTGAAPENLDFGATWGTSRDHIEGIAIFETLDGEERDIGPAVIEKPWKKQPPANAQIDWSNPIAQKLEFLYIGPHTGGAWGRDLVSGDFGVEVGATANEMTRPKTDQGHTLQQDGANGSCNYIAFQNVEFPSTFQAHFIRFRNVSAQQYYRSVMTLNATGWGQLLTVEPIVVEVDRFDLWIDDTHTQGWPGDGIAVSDTDNWYNFYSEFLRNGTAQDGYLSVNGGLKILQVNLTAGIGNAAQTCDEVSLGTSPIYTDEGMGGDLAFAAVFREALTQGEVTSLAANPWQLLKPQKVFVPPKPNRKVVTF